MLIKVMTNRNTERLISNVEDVEVHKGIFNFKSDAELNDIATKGPDSFNIIYGLFSPDQYPNYILTFDRPIDGRIPISDTEPNCGVNVQFVDFKKDGVWRRLAIECFAYICNDEGKTISRVVVEN